MAVSRYPIDIDRVEKGLYITPEEVEVITGASRESSSYGLAVLKVIGEIESQIGALSDSVTIRQHENGIRVLTDAEASSYHETRIVRSIGTIMRSNRKLHFVDVGQLSSDEQKSHERRVSRGAAYVQALAAANNGYKRLPSTKQVEA